MMSTSHGNRGVPSGVFRRIIAGVSRTGQGPGEIHSNLTEACLAFLEEFKFPTFEVLVAAQV